MRPTLSEVRAAAGRAQRDRSKGKLTPEAAEAIRREYTGQAGGFLHEVAARYGVSKATASLVVRRRIWR